MNTDTTSMSFGVRMSVDTARTSEPLLGAEQAIGPRRQATPSATPNPTQCVRIEGPLCCTRAAFARRRTRAKRTTTRLGAPAPVTGLEGGFALLLGGSDGGGFRVVFHGVDGVLRRGAPGDDGLPGGQAPSRPGQRQVKARLPLLLA